MIQSVSAADKTVEAVIDPGYASKSMSIGPVGWLLQARGRVKAPRRELDRRYHLFMRQMKPLHNLVDRGSHFQIVKNNGYRRPPVPEYPCAAALAGDALHGGAL
jgi:hypothetical protein